MIWYEWEISEGKMSRGNYRLCPPPVKTVATFFSPLFSPTITRSLFCDGSLLARSSINAALTHARTHYSESSGGVRAKWDAAPRRLLYYYYRIDFRWSCRLRSRERWAAVGPGSPGQREEGATRGGEGRGTPGLDAPGRTYTIQEARPLAARERRRYRATAESRAEELLVGWCVRRRAHTRVTLTAIAACVWRVNARRRTRRHTRRRTETRPGSDCMRRDRRSYTMLLNDAPIQYNSCAMLKREVRLKCRLRCGTFDTLHTVLYCSSIQRSSIAMFICYQLSTFLSTVWNRAARRARV